MPDARCEELSGGGIYHDAKPSQVNDATDYSRTLLLAPNLNALTGTEGHTRDAIARMAYN